MARALTGTVEWRSSKGHPEQWHARVTMPKEGGGTARPWLPLDAPHLKNTPADRDRARKLAAKMAKMAKDRGAVYVGERQTAPVRAQATIGELCDKWIDLVEASPEIKPATRHQHRSIVKAHLRPAFAERAPSELTTPVLRTFFREKTARKSASTVRNICNTLTKLIDDAMAEGWVNLSANPMRETAVRAVLPTVQAPAPEDIVHLSVEQVDRLLAAPALTDGELGAYLFGVLGGAREGETYGLRFSDLDLEDGVFRARLVQQALMPRGEGLGIVVGSLKSKNSRRSIPMHAIFCAWLVGWTITGWRAVVGRDPERDDLVFPDANGKAQRPRSAERIRDHLAAVGLPTSFRTAAGEEVPFDAHALRHTFATLMGEAEVAGDVVDRLLGHAPASTRGRHYMAPKLATLAKAIGQLAIAVPPKVSAPDDDTVSGVNRPGNRPESSPFWSRLRDLNSRPAVYETPRNGLEEAQSTARSHENQAAIASDTPPADTGQKVHSLAIQDPAGRFVGTIPESIESQLAEAIRAAAVAGQFEVVGVLAAELAARRSANVANVVPIRRPGRGT